MIINLAKELKVLSVRVYFFSRLEFDEQVVIKFDKMLLRSVRF